ncbi:MAG: aminotransferase class I/II-fold pyridoxal phosphate-dependent enzyme [Candidatus Geothermarchaeales archaeon]
MVVKPSVRWKDLPGESEYARRYRDVLSELEKAGKEVVALDDGDVVVYGHTNQPLSEFLVQAAREGWHMYPDIGGWAPRLRNAICEFQKYYNGVYYSPDDLIFCGGVAGCWAVMHYTLLDPGDELVVIEPAHYLWGPSSYLYLFQSRVVTSRCIEEEDWEPDLEDLRRKITDKTKGIVVVHPNNPTGAVYSDKALKEVISIAGEHDIPVLSDELYNQITWDGVEAKSVPALAGDVPVVMMHGVSKLFMRPGWRFAYIAFHDPEGKIAEVENVAKTFATLYGHQSKCIPLPIIVALTLAFENITEDRRLKQISLPWRSVYRKFVPPTICAVREMSRKLQRRSDFTFKRFKEMEGVSCTKAKGALYCLPRVHAIGKTWKTDQEFVIDLLKEEGIHFQPGSFFGPSGSGHIRTILTPEIEVLEDAYNRLEKFIARRTK